MATPRKIRPEAQIKLLSAEMQDALHTMCKTPEVSQDQMRIWLKNECGVDIKSNSTITDWYQWYCANLQLQRDEARVDQYVDAVRKQQPDLSDAELYEIGQRQFSLLAVARQDPETWAAVQNVAIAKDDLERKKIGDKGRAEFKKVDQQIAMRKLEIAESKIKKATEAVKEARKTGGDMTEAERTALLDKVDEILLGKK